MKKFLIALAFVSFAVVGCRHCRQEKVTVHKTIYVPVEPAPAYMPPVPPLPTK